MFLKYFVIVVPILMVAFFNPLISFLSIYTYCRGEMLPIDLADASLVILAEELGSGQILSVDYRDFNTYRWKNTEPFQNLFQEQM